MMRQIRVLSKLELINFFSLNVFRHTKDKKVKRTSTFLGITIGILIVLAMCYVGGLCFGLCKLGAEEIVPPYIVLLSSIFTLLFCAFKAGKIVFKESCYDILASMPIRKSTLVISRFVRLYAEGLMVACVVMLPGIGVYTWMVKPGILAVVLGVLSVFVVPVIPITLSVLLGVIITGISSKMKNKALFETLFVILVIIGLLSVTAVMPAEEISFDLQAIEGVAKDLLDIIYTMYPPTLWYAGALAEGSMGSLVVGALVSVALLGGVAVLTIANFENISRRLRTNTAKHDFKLGKLQKKSMRKTLVLREAKRYFSSGTYVTNTIIGPVMAVAFAIGMLFVDFNDAFKDLPVVLNVNAVIPLFFAGILVLNNPIATSVSMEGKEFWIIQTLPVSDKDILKSKLMFSIILLAPFYVVGELILIIALKPGLTELFWMLLLPMAVLLCALIMGLAVNLRFPKLKWDTEVEVVKQSASAMMGGFFGLLLSVITAVPLLVVPKQYSSLVAIGECAVVVVIAVLVNDKNKRFDLKQLN